MGKYKLFGLLIFLALVFSDCKKGPKVISSKVDDSERSTGIFDGSGRDMASNTTGDMASNIHQVKVKEVIQASKYVYLLVEEKGKEFWIATMKREVGVGETYFYQDGLLKKNFESKEHNRVFEEIYLVSNLVTANHGADVELLDPDDVPSQTLQNNAVVEKIELEDGMTSIADLIKNAEKLEGQTIQIKGKCVKINPDIMGKNWVHLKDGTKDDFDLVITTDEIIYEGQIVTIEALVVRNKDFGAGYKYDLILEEGVVLR